MTKRFKNAKLSKAPQQEKSMSDQMQILFRADPIGKQNLQYHFGRIKCVTTIGTHDGVHVTAHPEADYEKLTNDALTAFSWLGVESVNIRLQKVD